MSFQWGDTQGNNNSNPATIQSITVNEKVYDKFVVPTDYILTKEGLNPSANRIRENGGTTITNSNGGSAAWNTKALAAFQGKNLNHYFEANPNGVNMCDDFEDVAEDTEAQRQTLIYSPAIPSNEGGIVAITERNANNCFHIEVFGMPPGGGAEQSLGQTFVRDTDTQWGHGGTGSNNNTVNPPEVDSDYWLSNRVHEGNNTIGIALFYLKDIAPVGALITKVQLTAATKDHGDGKFFILQSYATDDRVNTIWNNSCPNGVNNPTLTGDVSDNDPVPMGSTYSVVSGSGTQNGTLQFLPTGSFTYTPNDGFSGMDSFEYQVCFMNGLNYVCDTATVSIRVIKDSDCDGVHDEDDLDDDNDGVLDTDEQELLDCNGMDESKFKDGPFAIGGANLTNPQVGDQFRFEKVYNDVDAIVTVVALNGDVIEELDVTSTGDDEFFQPKINHATADNFTEFRIDFVVEGTTTPAPLNNYVLTTIDNDVNEFVTYKDGYNR